ncbi:uncharacterized protein LOC118208353 isoform X3 [Anguilla anguilla]|uniref:uncharacterized protein LOC118208353 isoform X3 n=1 Tax=Anguilla anguilla TaxID=7936 RepID=UPI0015B30419|nr:uncharacterized protein LOC118208353 isoform X3 [Anguilla anguilla]
MTTHKSINILCKVKVKGLCLVLLCLHLTVADVPGPCRYSVRKDHLDTVRRLAENQLKNGCSITYTFTEQGNLSDTCYIKAAFPQILELIDTHFRFARSSDNGRYVEAMKALMHNMYSQKCIPPINVELEDDPAKFSKTHRGSPREALNKVLEVFSLYLELMSTRNIPVDWSCEEEYAKDELQFTTPLSQTTGAAECRCFNPTVDYGDSHLVSMTDSSLPSQTPEIPSFSSEAPGWDPLLQGTLEPMAVHWEMGSTSFKMAHGTDSGNRQKGGVFIPSAELPLLTAVGAKHSTGLSSTSSFKMMAFPPMKETRPFGTESDTSSVFSEAIHYRSQEGTSVMELSVSTTDLGEQSMSTASGISRDPARSTSRTNNVVTDLPVSHASFGPRIATIPSQVFVGNPSTPVPLQEFQVEGTPRRPRANAPVLLAKRSVKPRQDRSRADLSTNPAYPQRATTSTSQLPPAISMMIAREKDTPKTWLSDDTGQLRGLPTPAVRPTSSPDPELEALFRKTANNDVVGSAVPLGQDAGIHFRSGDPEGSHDSNTLAYIMAPVCGGLLFISAIYCLRRQKVGFMQHSLEPQDCHSMTAMTEIVVQ